MGELLNVYGEALARCAFCHDQCMSATAEVVATGDQSLVLSRVANLIRLADGDRVAWSPELARRLFYDLVDERQFEYCIAKKENHHPEPFLRAARAEAVRRNLAPASVMAVAEQIRRTGNVFGEVEQLPTPTPPAVGGPILVHDAAARLLTPGALTAARALLAAVGPAPGELAIPSGGMVEFDLGLADQARAAAEQTCRTLATLPEGPLVTTDPVLALALRKFYPDWGLGVNRPVLHISEHLAGQAEALPGFRPQTVTAVYHDPGALARGLGAVAPPRALLARVPGLKLVEPITTGVRAASDGPLRGYPDEAVAATISRERFAELRATGAGIIITSSPYSVANLAAVSDGTPVIDLVEFLHQAR